MMSYISYGFVLLVAAGFVISRLVRPERKMWVLLALSLIFMALAGGKWTILFWLISTAAGFSAAFFLAGHGENRRIVEDLRAEENPSAVRNLRSRRLVLCAAVLFQLGLLIYFKYANLPHYTLEALGEISGREYEFEPIVRIELLGISFYTLMVIGYMIDVYRGEIPAVRSFPAFALFTGYFGHFVQGPIDSYGKAGESLTGSCRATFTDVQDGVLRILLGLFKKLVISERLAVLVNTIYGDHLSYGGWYLILAAGAFSLQLYTDFSGCMDLVSGVSGLFGVRIEENFRQPFFSESVAEFWRRWHITLGAFLRKYVYIPLGGNRKGIFRKCVNVMIVFLLSGLWHGGKWTFIIGTGILQGVYITLGELLHFFTKNRKRKESEAVGRAGVAAVFLRIFRRVRTFVLISAGFVLFRADSLTMAGEIFRGMAGESVYSEFEAGVFHAGLGRVDFAVLVIGLIILFLLSCWREKKGQIQILPGEGMRTVACFAVLFLIILFGWYGRGYDMGAFIYSQF